MLEFFEFVKFESETVFFFRKREGIKRFSDIPFVFRTQTGELFVATPSAPQTMMARACRLAQTVAVIIFAVAMTTIMVTMVSVVTVVVPFIEQKFIPEEIFEEKGMMPIVNTPRMREARWWRQTRVNIVQRRRQQWSRLEERREWMNIADSRIQGYLKRMSNWERRCKVHHWWRRAAISTQPRIDELMIRAEVWKNWTRRRQRGWNWAASGPFPRYSSPQNSITNGCFNKPCSFYFTYSNNGTARACMVHPYLRQYTLLGRQKGP